MSDLFIIGSSQPETAVGNQLREAANDLGLKAQLFEIADGHGTGLSRRLTYKFLGDYPLRGRAFNIRILDALRDQKPRYLLSTGKAPLFSNTLKAARELGIQTINFSTDDPWNPLYKASWALRALKSYDFVATPRCANLTQMRQHVRRTHYIQFGYSPSQHYWTDLPEAAQQGDVFFAGAAIKTERHSLQSLSQLEFGPHSMVVIGRIMTSSAHTREAWPHSLI